MDSNFFDEFSKIQSEMNRFMNHLQNLSKVQAGFSTTGWIPEVNIYDKEDQYIILAELPGVDPEKLKVNVHHSTLTIQGEKRLPSSVQSMRCQHMEICFGPFVRTVRLPEPVNSDNIRANYHQGFLEIAIPKQSPEKRRREIPIQSQE